MVALSGRSRSIKKYAARRWRWRDECCDSVVFPQGSHQYMMYCNDISCAGASERSGCRGKGGVWGGG